MRALDRQWFSGPESEIAPSEEATARNRSAAVRRLDALRPLTSVLTTKDHALLEGHLLQPGPQDGPAALPLDMMRIKLADARLVLSQNVDPDIATADSRVVYATDRRPAQTAILVHWEHELTRDIALPVTTPLGLALLGLKAGQSAPYLHRKSVRSGGG